MTIRGLLVSGAKKCGSLEKVADFILAIPSAMYYGKKVSIADQSQEQTHQMIFKKGLDYFHESDPNSKADGATVGMIILTPFLLIGVLLTVPFLGIGLPLKKIDLLQDKKAMAYHEFIEKVIEKDLLESYLKDGFRIEPTKLENTANACNAAYVKYMGT